MTVLPYWKFWPADFYSDPLVQALPGEARAIYRVLLDQLWINGGWLPNDDAVIAKRLGIHHHAWRLRYKPLLTPLVTVGVASGVIPTGVITQKRVSKEYALALDKIERNRARTQPARSAKARRKQGKAAAVTERNPASVVEPATPQVEHSYPPSNAQSTRARVARPRQPLAQEEESSAPNVAESFLPATSASLGALPPGDYGEVEGSDRVASPAGEGRSAPGPSFPAAAPRAPPVLSPRIEAALAKSQPPIDAGPTSSLLNSRIVKEFRRNGHVADPEPDAQPERDRDDQGEVPKPAGELTGIAAALAAFGKKGSEGEG